jgi:hypothetical protein
LGRHRSHLGALGVQPMKGQVDSLLLHRPHRSAREGAALTIGSLLVLYYIDMASASGGASRAFMLKSRQLIIVFTPLIKFRFIAEH